MTTIVSQPDAQFHGLLQRAATPAPVGGQLRVLPSQSVVFVAQGRVAGVLGPGEHPLDPQIIPFLAPIVQQRPTGPVLGDDLVWVKTGAIATLDVSGAFDTRHDPAIGERVTPKVSGRLHVSVGDPVRLLTELGGNPDRAALETWLRNEAVAALKTAASSVGRLVDLVNPKSWPGLEQTAGAALGPALAQRGIALSRLELLQISVPDEISSRLRLLMSQGTQPGTAATPGGAPFRVTPGARVRMTRDGRWFSGTVIEVNDAGGQAQVEWDPGTDRSWGPISAFEPEPTYPGAHTAGTRVLARHGDGSFYPAVVRHFNGTHYSVTWDNGTSAWLEPGEVRLS